MDIIGEIVHNYLHIPLIMASVLVYGVLLYYIFFKPVQKIIDERRGIIQKGELLSQKAKEESERKLAFVEEKLREARKEGLKKREEAKKELLEYQAKLLERVKIEIEREKEKREAEFEIFEKKTKEEIKTEIPQLAKMMAEKVLKRSVSS
ncbi:MAG: ATP synthase F0 subunit B [Acidobacteria bacterium]|nr:ATP synthase F0 subunit B [Acidobacteriota bacterium]